MQFFKQIRLRMMRKYWIIAAVFLLLGLIWLRGMFNPMEADDPQKLIPFVTISFLLSLFFICKPFLKYASLISSAKRIGDPDKVGKTLEKLPLQSMVCGEMRYDKTMLFYRSGAKAHLCRFAEIESICVTELDLSDDHTYKHPFMVQIELESRPGFRIKPNNSDIKASADNLCSQLTKVWKSSTAEKR